MTKVPFDVCHLCGAIRFLHGTDSFIPLHMKARSPLDLLSSKTPYTCHCDRLLLLNCGIATTQITVPRPTMVPFSRPMVVLDGPSDRRFTLSRTSTTLIGLGIE